MAKFLPDRRHFRLALIAAPIGLVVAASAFLLFAETGKPIDARPPLAVLTAAAIAAWPFRVPSAGRKRAFRATALLAASLLLTLHVLGRVPILGMAGDYGGVFLAWLLAVALYFLALGALEGGLARPVASQAFPRGAAAWLLGACVAVAATLRLWRLGSVPYVFSGDEASFGLWTGGLSLWPMSNPFSAGWLSQPTLGMLYELVSLKLLGIGAASARLPWTLLSILTVPVAFLLAARLRGTAVGLVTAALLAAYHFHIHYARVALNNIADPLFLALALVWLLRAIDGKRLLAWALTGGTSGLALYFYQGARLTPLVVGAVASFAWLRLDREGRKGFPAGLAAAVGAFAVAAAPMLQFAFLDPATFNARVNQISIFQPGWLANEVVVTNQSAVAILGGQLIHALGAFNLYPDTAEHYGLLVPLLDPLFGLLFLGGMLYATGKALFSRRDWPLIAPVLWWWSGTVIGGALTFSPPASQRLVTLTVPVCFFIALALWQTALGLRRASCVPAPATLAVGTLLFAAMSLKTYFRDFTPSHRYGGTPAALMMELMPAAEALGPEGSVVFAGAPYVYWDFGTRAFLAPRLRGRDALQPFVAPISPDTVQAGETVLFVFVPERAAERAFVQRTFPDGLASELTSPADGRVLAMLYKVTR